MNRQSPYTNSSSRADSVSSDRKWGIWHWDLSPVPQPRTADQDPALILTNKRSRTKPTRFPDRENYSGETNETLHSQETPKSRKKPNLAVEIKPPIRKNKDLVCEPTTFGSNRNNTKDNTVSKGDNESSCEVKLLKHQIDLLATRHSHMLKSLEDQLLILKDENSKLYGHLEWYRKMEKAKADYPDEDVDHVKELNAELERKDSEIGEKIKQNECLTEQVNSTEGLNSILKDFRSGHVVATRFLEEMTKLEANTSRAARVFVQCLSGPKIAELAILPRGKTKLDLLVEGTLGTMDLLSTYPKSAMCALIFGFIRDQVFHAGCWAALAQERYMLRGYQEIIHKSFPQGTIEGFHRAAIEMMLERNHQFRDCWVQSQVENAQCTFLNLCNSFLDESKVKDAEKDMKEALNRLLTDAFYFRARCVPPNASHYELIHFEPGDVFDSNFMEARGVDGTPVSVSDGKGHLIRLCVHGCLVAHAIEANSIGAGSPNKLSESFISTMDEGISTTGGGVLKSEKAIVLLGDTLEP
ncbi:hypothetical protein N7501_010957 [Penicillium viridicatum]|nr:hypothetical protein N7501_010957 [Penicillium viridicatum]